MWSRIACQRESLGQGPFLHEDLVKLRVTALDVHSMLRLLSQLSHHIQ